MTSLPIGHILLALGLLFLAAACNDYLKRENKLTPARQTWLRIAQIFAAVTIGLAFWQMLVH